MTPKRHLLAGGLPTGRLQPSRAGGMDVPTAESPGGQPSSRFMSCVAAVVESLYSNFPCLLHCPIAPEVRLGERACGTTSRSNPCGRCRGIEPAHGRR